MYLGAGLLLLLAYIAVTLAVRPFTDTERATLANVLRRR